MSAVPHNPALIPPGLAAASSVRTPAGPRPSDGPAFGQVLRERAVGVQFSGHAIDRLRRRGIEVDVPTLQRLDGAVRLAASKGSRESLVLVDGTAFVVSVRNRTVITAVDRASMREHVFTNIDSAVIA